jgi:inorganic pyrophosphatase
MNNNSNDNIENQGPRKISFLHDISYKNNDNQDTYNMVYEIGYGETAKMEMSKEEFNPIIQDTKKDKISGKYLRYYKIPPLFNYGFIPQTWESTKVKHRNLYIGDDDPIDVIELSLPNKNISNENKENLNTINNSRISSGKISKIHIFGCFCLLDQNEIDWKILALNADIFNKEEAENYFYMEKNQIRIKEIMHWFKIYKTYEGKKENIILDNDKIFSRNETLEIIKENHNYYLNSLIKENKENK